MSCVYDIIQKCEWNVINQRHTTYKQFQFAAAHTNMTSNHYGCTSSFDIAKHGDYDSECISCEIRLITDQDKGQIAYGSIQLIVRY